MKKLFSLWLLLCIFYTQQVYAQCQGDLKFSLETSPCVNNSLTFNNSSTGSADKYQWLWGDGTTDTTTTQTALAVTHTFTKSGVFEVTLIKKCGSNQVVKKTNIKIVDFPNTSVISNIPITSCAQEDVNLSILSPENGVTYSWNFDDVSSKNNTATGNTVNHSFTATGNTKNYSVQVNAINAEGCSRSFPTHTVSIKSTPTIVLTDDGDFLETSGSFTRCQIDGNSTDSVYNFTFLNESISDNPATTYNWNWGDGTTTDRVGTSTETHEYKEFGVKNLVITATNPTTNCSATFTQSIINEKFPSASLSIPPSQVNICDKQSVTIDNNSKNATSYTWVWGDGDSTFTEIKEPTSHTFTLTEEQYCQVTTALGIELQVLLIAKNSCFTHTNTSPLNVRPKPNPTFTTPTDMICKTSATSTHDITFIPSTCPDRTIQGFPTILEFEFGDPTSGSNTKKINPNKPLTANHTYTDAGVYIINLTGTNNCGVGTFSDTITILEPAVASFTNGDASKSSADCANAGTADFTPQSDCGPFTIDLKNTSLNLTDSDKLDWSATGPGTAKFGSTNSFTSQSPDDNLSFTKSGTYTITLSVSNDCNSSPSTSCAVVNVKGIPDINADPKTSIAGLSPADNPNFQDGTGTNAGKLIACGTQDVSTLTIKNDQNVEDYKWDILGVNGTSNPIVTNPNQKNAGNVTFNPGEYQIKATVSNKCGNVDLPPLNIIVTDPPIVDAGGKTPTNNSSACDAPTPVNGAGNMKELVICSGDTAFLGNGVSDGALTYQWTVENGGQLPTKTNELNTNIILENQTSETSCTKYFLEADNGACTSKDSILVIVKNEPIVNIGLTNSTPSDTNVCLTTGNFTLFANPSTGTWSSISSPKLILNSNQFNPDTAGLGTHSVQYNYTDPITSCKTSAIKKIQVNGLPTIDISAVLIDYCESDLPFQINGLPANGTWSSKLSDAITSDGKLTSSKIGAGNSTELIYEFTDANTCTNSDTIKVSVSAPSKPIIGKNDSICQNAGTFQLKDFTPTNGVWSADGLAINAITTTGLFDPTNLPIGSYKVIYTINKGTPCEQDTSKLIFVKEIPTVTTGTYNVLCQNADAINLNGLPSGGTWSGSTAISIVGNDTLFNPKKAIVGLNEITYSFTNDKKCTVAEKVKIEVKALPIISAGKDQLICINPSPFQLTDFSPTNGTWKLENASQNSIDNDGKFTATEAKKENAIYTFTDANQCTNSDTIIVTVSSPIKPSIGLSDSICQNAGTFQLKNFTPTNGTWSGIGNSAITNTGLFDPSNLTAGDYTVKYTINEGTTCEQDTTKTIVVKEIPIVTTGTYGPFCADDNPSKISGLPSSGTWSGSTAVSILGNDTLFNPSKVAIGFTELTYTFTNTNQCTVSEKTSIEVKELPVVFAGNDMALCTNKDAFQLSGFTPTSGGNGAWKVITKLSPNTITNEGLFSPNQTSIDTLVYTFSLPSGCFRTDTMVITVTPPTQANAGNDQVICVDNGILQLVPDVSTPYDVNKGSKWTGTGIIATTDQFDPTLLSESELNTDLNIVYSYGGGNCITHDTLKIKSFALPKITLPTIPTGTLCEDENAIVLQGYTANTIGVTSFDATFGAWTGTGISKNGSVYSFESKIAKASTSPFVLTYTYIDKNTNNCKSVAAYEINVAPLPTANFVIPDVHCKDTQLSIQNTSTISFTSLQTNDWNFGDGESNAIQKNQNHGDINYTFLNSGVFDIELRVISDKGCDSTISKSIKIISPPTAKFTLTNSPSSKCGPVTSIIKDFSTGFDSVYTWNFGNGDVSKSFLTNDTSIIYPAGRLSDTTYTISLEVQNQCGIANFKDSVFVFPVPIADFGIDKNSGCSPAPFEFSNTSLGLINDDPSSYVWKFSDGSAAIGPLFPTNLGGVSVQPVPSTKFFTYEGIDDTTYTITLIATNRCGVDSIQKQVKVFPKNAKAFFNQSVNDGCSPLEIQFTDFSTGANTISWNFGDNTTIVEKNPIHTFTNTGTIDSVYTIFQYVNNGCSYDTISQQVTVFPSPTVDFSFNKTNVCQGVEITFKNLSQGINNSTWIFAEKDTIINLTSDVKFTFDTAGIIPVTLIGKENIQNCAVSKIKNIQIIPPPTSSIQASDTIGCNPLEITFDGTTSSDAVAFFWDFADGNSSINSIVKHSFENDGLYRVKLITENKDLCQDTTEIKIIVHEKPSAKFVEKSNQGECELPVLITYANQSSSAAKGFTWKIDDKVISTLTNPTLSFTEVKNYNIKLVTSSINGCLDSTNIDREILPLPIANFTLLDSTGCSPFNAQFINTSKNASTYTWNFGDKTSNSSTEINNLHLYTKGSYTPQLIAQSNAGCIDTITSITNVLTINSKPIADFTYLAEEEIEQYGTIYFTNTSQNAVSYNWDFGDGNTNDTDTSLVSHKFEFYGEKPITLIATNEFQCMDTLIKVIDVPFFGALFVPNAFSPDAGTEDARVFLPKGIGLEQYHCQVYDTWGILLWESTELDENGSPAESWNGIHNGKELPQNAYVWKIQASFIGGRIWQGMKYEGDKLSHSKGTVTLIR